jgi:hypothetical protein
LHVADEGVVARLVGAEDAPPGERNAPGQQGWRVVQDHHVDLAAERRAQLRDETQARFEAIVRGRVRVVAQQDTEVEVAVAMRTPLGLAAEQVGTSVG